MFECPSQLIALLCWVILSHQEVTKYCKQKSYEYRAQAEGSCPVLAVEGLGESPEEGNIPGLHSLSQLYALQFTCLLYSKWEGIFLVHQTRKNC